MRPAGKLSIEPLYTQVRNLLAKRIAAGIWTPGSMLPNEIELARELGVSPGTVRKALDILERDRLVLRKQGRGTSVIDQGLGDVAARFSNIRNEGGRRIAGDMELLSQTSGAATDDEARQLQLNAGEPVLRTSRVRRYQGEPFMHEEASLALTRFPGLAHEDAGNYRISALAQRHGIQLTKASERVSSKQAGKEAAERLQVDSTIALLRLDRVIYTLDGFPVEWRVAHCDLKDGLTYITEQT